MIAGADISNGLRRHCTQEATVLLPSRGIGTAALAGCTALSSLTSTTHTNETTRTIGPKTDGLTDAERERYVDRMAERYGSWAADQIVPETVGLQPGLEPATPNW